MYYKFERLEIWNIARKFISEIYSLTKKFPKEELFGLTSQIRRAAVSIALNIAEGCNRSQKEFAHFLRIALTSLEEVVTALYIASDLKLIDKEEFDKLYDKSHELAAKINSLINKINNK